MKKPGGASKNKARATTESAGKAASVQQIFSEARRLIESATILRSVRDAVVPRFRGEGAKRPDLLLQRPGEGPRLASVDGVVDLEIAMENLALQFEERARALLGLPVAVADLEVPPLMEVSLIDRVVEFDERRRLADECQSKASGSRSTSSDP